MNKLILLFYVKKKLLKSWAKSLTDILIEFVIVLYEDASKISNDWKF